MTWWWWQRCVYGRKGWRDERENEMEEEERGDITITPMEPCMWTHFFWIILSKEQQFQQYANTETKISQEPCICREAKWCHVYKIMKSPLNEYESCRQTCYESHVIYAHKLNPKSCTSSLLESEAGHSEGKHEQVPYWFCVCILHKKRHIHAPICNP